MENPKELKYTKEHEWVKIEGNVATVGVTDYAQKMLTDVVFVELPKVGKKVEATKQMCIVESVKSVSDVYAPLTGEVVEVNKSLESQPELVNNEPFDKGWIAKLKVSNPADAENLMTAEDYDKYLAGLEKK